MPRNEKNSDRAERPLWTSPVLVAAILLFSFCINSDAEDLAALLVSPDYEKRRQAEETLLGLGREALPICLKMADEENLASKFCAARVLRKLVPGSVTHHEIKSLKNSTFPELSSIYFSALPDSREGITELLSGAQAPQREIRLASLNRLIELKVTFNPDPLLTLLQAVAPGDPHRVSILSALVESAPSPRWEAVAGQLNDSDPEIVTFAAQVLGRWKVHESAERLYCTGINSPNERVRQASFRALAAIGDEGKSLILKDCESNQGHVREQAALALGFFQNTHSQLVEMLERDPYERVAQAASISLQHLYQIDEPQYFFPYDGSPAARDQVVKAWKQFIAGAKE
ncbi:MAG: HEAT repeat domain-containing protein [Planctomycetota bacterium]|nr:HEAT repeat domain-containing protein [Planctomycetota bacterium]